MMSNPQQIDSSIVVRFNVMRLEVASSCMFDFLEIREGRFVCLSVSVYLSVCLSVTYLSTF